MDKVVHIRLPNSHKYYGDTPRLIGSMLAIREKCYGLMYLDADNIFYDDHVYLSVSAHLESSSNYVVAQRDMLRPDGSVIKVERQEEISHGHVDTSCMIFFGEGMFTALQWSKIPSELSVVGDRYFWNLARKTEIQNFAVINKPTIGYECLWKEVYQSAGEIPPENSKVIDSKGHDEFITQLTQNELIALKKRIHNY